ncbi:polysaccharide biosynthesis/export family protein [Wenyingzhuangia sp. IMCC45533]
MSTYLQGETTSNQYNFQHKIYKTQINDLLLINVTSKDVELTQFFNSLGNNSSQSAGNVQQINPYVTGYRIDKDGNVRLPYLGKVGVLNMTFDEIRIKLENLLSQYIKNKDAFFVSVKGGGIKYTILGEISNPGSRLLLQYEANIIDAIADSGDVTQYGNRTNVEIIRQENGAVKKHIVDLTNINSINSDVFLIKNNDIINIKPINQKPIGLGTTGLSVFNTILSTFSVTLTTILFIRTL